jgi:hypothetical protein
LTDLRVVAGVEGNSIAGVRNRDQRGGQVAKPYIHREARQVAMTRWELLDRR